MLWFRNLIWATLLATVAAAQTPSTLDYTQWRGNGRDGSASGFIPPATWPEQLTRGWSVEVGEGYGTPLVVGTVVYTFTRRGGDEVRTTEDSFQDKFTRGAGAHRRATSGNDRHESRRGRLA